MASCRFSLLVVAFAFALVLLAPARPLWRVSVRSVKHRVLAGATTRCSRWESAFLLGLALQMRCCAHNGCPSAFLASARLLCLFLSLSIAWTIVRPTSFSLRYTRRDSPFSTCRCRRKQTALLSSVALVGLWSLLGFGSRFSSVGSISVVLLSCLELKGCGCLPVL